MNQAMNFIISALKASLCVNDNGRGLNFCINSFNFWKEEISFEQ